MAPPTRPAEGGGGRPTPAAAEPIAWPPEKTDVESSSTVAAGAGSIVGAKPSSEGSSGKVRRVGAAMVERCIGLVVGRFTDSIGMGGGERAALRGGQAQRGRLQAHAHVADNGKRAELLRPGWKAESPVFP